MSLPQFFLRAAKSIRLSPAEKIDARESIVKTVRKLENSRLTLGMQEETFFRTAQSISLTPAEKALIKEALFDAMHQKSTSAWWLLPFKSFASLTAALLIVVISGAGLSYAAEAAMPGDLLYPVKIHVNEGIKSSLARSPMAKATVETERAERRLQEAEALLATDALQKETSVMLAQSLRSNIAMAQTATRAMMESDADMAVSVGMDIEATLAAHARLLAKLDPQQNDMVAELIKTIDDMRMEVEEGNIAASVHANPTALVAALHRKISVADDALISAGTMAEKSAQPTAARSMAMLSVPPDTEEQIRTSRMALRRMKELKLMEGHPDMAFSDPSSVESLSVTATASDASVPAAVPPVSSGVRSNISNSSAAVHMTGSSSSVAPKRPPREKEDAEDMMFSTKVRLQMTEKKIRSVEEKISTEDTREQRKNDAFSLPPEARLQDAKNMMDMVKVKMDEGDVDAALEASKKALQHADEAVQELDSRLKGL